MDDGNPTMPNNRARFTAAGLAVATASKSTVAGATGMRIELIGGLAAMVLSAVGAEAVGVPDQQMKWILIAVGTVFGSITAAFALPNADPRQRVARGLLSMAAGPIFSLVALTYWPSHSSFDARDWIVVVAAAVSFASWVIVRWAQKRQSGIDDLLDSAAERSGFPKPKTRRSRAPKAAERDEHEDGGP